MTASPPPTHFLRTLGIAGWDALDPVFLAAVATESPLLLVGPHGSAKTMVLNRLAETLGLEHRHYNASLLSFDDLVGFPVPENGRVVYLQTPATVWEAESVLVDEVSRCRPEVQNKLFPLVHERVIQGLPLPRLRHRWAAMNPPTSLEGDDAGDPLYSGAEPLDVALADRFAFVVTVPSLAGLSPDDQRRVLRPSAWSADEARPVVTRLVEGTREALAPNAPAEAAAATEYSMLLAAHRTAWAAAGLSEGSARRRLLGETDPFARIAIVLDGDLPPHEAAEALADSYSLLPLPERLVAASFLMPRLAKRRDLPAAALEAVANDWARVGAARSAPVTVGPGTQWMRPLLTSEMPKLDARTAKGRTLTAVAAALLHEAHPFKVDDLAAAWERAAAALAPARRSAA